MTQIGRAIKNSDDARMLQDDLIEVRIIVTMDWVKRGRYMNLCGFSLSHLI